MRNSRLTNIAHELKPTAGTTHQENAIGGTAESLLNSSTVATGTTHVWVQFTDAPCRVTFDGSTTPTSSLGFLYSTNSSAILEKDVALAAQAINTGTTCNVEYQEMSF